jgi:hypothetical protein
MHCIPSLRLRPEGPVMAGINMAGMDLTEIGESICDYRDDPEQAGVQMQDMPDGGDGVP